MYYLRFLNSTRATESSTLNITTLDAPFPHPQPFFSSSLGLGVGVGVGVGTCSFASSHLAFNIKSETSSIPIESTFVSPLYHPRNIYPSFVGIGNTSTPSPSIYSLGAFST